MDEPNDRDDRSLKKGYLKNQLIWEQVESFRSYIQDMSKQIDSYVEFQNKFHETLAKLPDVNLKNILKVEEFDPKKHKNKKDVCRFYKKTDDGYVYKEPEMIDLTLQDEKIDSIKWLSSKVAEGEEVFAMTNPNKPWIKCNVIVVYQKRSRGCNSGGYSTIFRLRTQHDNMVIQVNKYSIARIQDHQEQLEPPKRVIAGTDETKMFPGTLGYHIEPHTNHRYLVIMDDGSASYFKSNQIYPIVGQSQYPWIDSHYIQTGTKFNQYYLLDHFLIYPQRNLVHIDKSDYKRDITIYRNGQLAKCRIIGEDHDLMKVRYDNNEEETLYKGSLRIRKQQHESEIKTRYPSLSLSETQINKFKPRLMINLKHYYDAGCTSTSEDIYKFAEDFGNIIVSSGGDKNSTSKSPESPRRIRVELDEVRVVEIDDESSGSSSSSRTNTHQCNPDCLEARGAKTESSIKNLIDEFRHLGHLKVPLALGWKRAVRESYYKSGTRLVAVYEAPCGKEFKAMYMIHRYLIKTKSKLDIDYFSDDIEVDLDKKMPPLTAFYYLENMAFDSDTHEPLENKNISAINQFNEEELAFDFRYASKSFLHPRLVRNGMTMNTEFKSGCDCEDDCHKQDSCACHRLTEQAYGNISSTKPGYVHKRLLNFFRTGIFECNSLCKCSSKCRNRVVQNGIIFRFQVRKTLNKGWGLVTLDDIPRGAFVCCYSAEILDDADKYGNDDMYFADMDYVTVNENAKMLNYDPEDETESGVGSTSDSSDDDIEFILEKKVTSSTSGTSGSDTELASLKSDANTSVKRQRNKAKKTTTSAKKMRKSSRNNTHNSEQVKPHKKKHKSPKFKRIHEILQSHDYTLDARLSGNVGRFCNHSCEPNCYVQNVFIDTHDPRYPVPALFADRTIKALEEITWDYGYTMGSIPGREIICNCGAKTCKGRIL